MFGFDFTSVFNHKNKIQIKTNNTQMIKITTLQNVFEPSSGSALTEELFTKFSEIIKDGLA